MYKLGVMGKGISYSLSPQIHKEFAKQFDIKIDYQIYDIEDDPLNFVEGFFAKGELHPILLESGWNMIGYLRDEPESVQVIFNDLVTQGIIRLVKDYQGNIYLPEWNFNAIGNMEPGLGYQVKTFNEGVLLY